MARAEDVTVAPTLPTACGSLPPEGAAAPAARRSRFRGPGWLLTPVRPNSCPPTASRVASLCMLHSPRGGCCACGPAKPVPRPWLVAEASAPQPLSAYGITRCITLYAALTRDGAAAPAARRSRFRGPGWLLKPLRPSSCPPTASRVASLCMLHTRATGLLCLRPGEAGSTAPAGC